MKYYNFFEPVQLKPTAKEYFSDFSIHKSLINDENRLSTFKKAIIHAVKRNDVVVDIGAGTGILSKYAIEAGAKKVYLIEENHNILKKAIQNLTKYGYSKKCVFISGRSQNFRIEQNTNKVNVIISETIGSLGINEGILNNFADIKRLTNSDTLMMPQSMNIFLSTIEKKHDFKIESPVIFKGDINFKIIDTYKIASFDFTNIEEKDHNILFKLDKTSECLMACIWFQCKLYNNIYISNYPYPKISKSWGVCLLPDFHNDLCISIFKKNCRKINFSFSSYGCFNYNYCQYIL